MTAAATKPSPVPVETGLVALSPALTFEDMWFESASEAEPPVLETETASKAQEAEGLAAVPVTGSRYQSLACVAASGAAFACRKIRCLSF